VFDLFKCSSISNFKASFQQIVDPFAGGMNQQSDNWCQILSLHLLSSSKILSKA
jgi:hypothetical protein